MPVELLFWVCVIGCGMFFCARNVTRNKDSMDVVGKLLNRWLK